MKTLEAEDRIVKEFLIQRQTQGQNSFATVPSMRSIGFA
jgi:hypothetical protein